MRERIREMPARRDREHAAENDVSRASPVQVVKVQQRWLRRRILPRYEEGAERRAARSGALSAVHYWRTPKRSLARLTERQRPRLLSQQYRDLIA
jgi:hypothetical protein